MARYKNDKKGAPACDPALLLKVILYSYSKGITSSRGIETLCREETRSLFRWRFMLAQPTWCRSHNVIYMALRANEVPYFTAITLATTRTNK
jgi:transposase